MRRCALAALLATLVAAQSAHSGVSARQICDTDTAAGSFVDCFSGLYHGTGFLPMEETIRFKRVSGVTLRSEELWRLWVADAKRMNHGTPCANRNAVAYIGSFSFYGSGTFVACSQSSPHMLSGFYKVKKRFFFADGSTHALLTQGPMSGSAARDKVVELVFSDSEHRHYAQPEVVLGPSPVFR